MSKIGSVNPCNMCSLYNNLNERIGQCIDTPNAFAYACIINPNVFKSIAQYQFFGTEYRYVNEDDIKDRINIFAKQNFDVNEIKQKFFIKFYE